jgi:hypothetical protein
MRQRFSRPPSRQFIRRIGSSIIVLSFVLLTACGKKSDFAVVHAVLSPPGDELPEEFTLVTPLEEKPFDVDGTAEARVRRNAVSLVAAVRPDGKMALMDIVVVDDSSSDVDVSLDATQTVRALAFLWPPNITLELTQANEVLKTIESDLFFSKAVSQFPKPGKSSIRCARLSRRPSTSSPSELRRACLSPRSLHWPRLQRSPRPSCCHSS